MASYKKSVSDVPTGGQTVEIPIHRAMRHHPLDRIDIVDDDGNASQVDWEVNETSSLNEIDQVAEDDAAGLPVHVQAQDGGWSFDGLNLENGALHVHLEPDAQTSMTVKLSIDKDE